MEVFALCLLILITLINMTLSIGNALVLIKIYEASKVQEERYEMEEEAKWQARGLMDVMTPQAQYIMRPTIDNK